MRIAAPPLRLFEGFGVEIEYMVVDAATLDVRPVVDELLAEANGGEPDDHEDGDIAWSNELVNHVIELKTNGPAISLAEAALAFRRSLETVGALLVPRGLALLPGAMHPWMDPARETAIWPHAYSEVYRAYDRVFDCKRHGWANLQSVHLNLPFTGDGELRRLHAAVRPVLALIPGLAAASPVCDGAAAGALDARLEVYRTNSRRTPSMTGRVIPEHARSRAEYERLILRPIYAEVAALDPTGALRGEFLNARGAIVRFDRDAIEVRLIDAQECPAADLAICAAVTAAVRALCAERFAPLAALERLEVEPLHALLVDAIRRGPAAEVRDEDLLLVLGLRGRGPLPLREVWRHLAGALLDPGDPEDAAHLPALETILARGTLAERLLARLGGDLSRGALHRAWSELVRCLREDRLLDALE